MFLFLSAAFAGDPGPLCDALVDVEAVVEIRLTASGAYPEDHRARGWAPPDEAIAPTVASAQITRIWRGAPDALAGWTPTADDLNLRDQPVAWWDQLFAAGEFSALVLLSRWGESGALSSAGWLEDSGTCNVSWCWEALREALLACDATMSAETAAEAASTSTGGAGGGTPPEE